LDSRWGGGAARCRIYIEFRSEVLVARAVFQVSKQGRCVIHHP
jgi:hypothetical protein